jgi:hypothetical protein
MRAAESRNAGTNDSESLHGVWCAVVCAGLLVFMQLAIRPPSRFGEKEFSGTRSAPRAPP